MGFIRGGLLVIVSVLLFVVFLAGNVLWTLDKSLEYDTIKSELASIVEEVLKDQINVSEVVTKEFSTMETYCENNPGSIFNHDESGRVFELPCEVIANGPEAVKDHAINSLVEEVYNGQIEENKFDFASIKEKISSYLYLAFGVILILFVLVFFLTETKSNSFIIAGSLLSISALPFVKIEPFLSWIPFKFAESFIVFFSQAYSVFLISLITGLIVLAVGIIMKFFGVGFKLFGFMNKIKPKEKTQKVSTHDSVSPQISQKKTTIHTPTNPKVKKTKTKGKIVSDKNE